MDDGPGAAAPGFGTSVAHPARICSFLVLLHATSDIQTGRVAAGTERYIQRSAVPITPRPRAQVTRFFDGLQIIDPGVVPLGQWHPGPPQHFDSPGLPTYCVVGRKP